MFARSSYEMRTLLKKNIYLLSFLGAATFGQIHRAEIWSEGLYAQRESQFRSSIIARAYAPTGFDFQPYLQMGQSTLGYKELSSDWYLASGLHWSSRSFRAFGEYRVHPQNGHLLPNEWRVLFVYGDLFEKSLKASSSYFLFFEPYAEASWVNLSENSISINLLPRSGFRFRVNRDTTSDVYLEPAIYLNSKAGISPETELRPTARVRHCMETFCFSLAGSQAAYFQLLATFGGSL